MEQPRTGKEKNLALFFLAPALILRLSVLLIAWSHPERTLTNDSPSYIEPAQYLLRDAVYTHPSALRTPVYPLFLAVIYGLFGENQFYVVLAQVLLGLLTLYLTYKLSNELFPAQKNLAGILFLAWGSESILSPFYVMTETLFTFLLVCTLLAVLAYFRSSKYSWLVVCGALSGLAILCRPIAVYFPGMILLLLMWEHRQKPAGWLKAGAIYISVALFIVVPWVVRNDRVVGTPVVSTITGDSLLFYSANALVAHQQGVGFFDAQKAMYSALDQALSDADLPNTERNRYNMEMSMARQIILQAPVTYLYVHVRDSLKVFLPGAASLRDALGQADRGVDLWDLLQTQGLSPALTEYFRQTHGLQLLLTPFVLLLFVTCLGGLLGAIVLLKRRSLFALMVLFLPVVYLVIFSGPGAYSRFRIPLMPFLSVLAGIGLGYIEEKYREKFK